MSFLKEIETNVKNMIKMPFRKLSRITILGLKVQRKAKELNFKESKA